MSLTINIASALSDVFNQSEIKSCQNGWAGQALILGSEYVIRESYRMEDGRFIKFNLPDTKMHKAGGCFDGYLLTGLCGGERVMVNVVREHVMTSYRDGEPEWVMAPHLTVMTPGFVAAEVFLWEEPEDIAWALSTRPWEKWTESRAAEGAASDYPSLNAWYPEDLTVEPAFVSFGEEF